MPLTAVQLLSVPPMTVKSAAVKSLDDALSVKVTVAVSPACRAVPAVTLLVTATVGRTVLTLSAKALLAAALVLPAASATAPAASWMLPAVVLLSLGVNVPV